MKPFTDTGQNDKACTWCGKTLIKPRRNQSYCNKECRESHKRLKKGRNTSPYAQRQCECCGKPFEPKKVTQEFCSTQCQQKFNNYWKGQGPKLAKAMTDWRVKRVSKGISVASRAFADAREGWKEIQKKMREG